MLIVFIDMTENIFYFTLTNCSELSEHHVAHGRQLRNKFKSVFSQYGTPETIKLLRC